MDSWDLSADAIIAQLQRIVLSEHFDASTRNRTFLEFVVHETLGGRSDRIKAYTIATSALGRGSDFDPQQDSIVRIEAGRLRRSLERYYLKAGQNDPIRITIPTGSYVPHFSSISPLEDGEASGTQAVSPVPRSRPRHLHAIMVVPFEKEGDQSAFPNFTRGFCRQIGTGLTRFEDLSVFGPYFDEEPPVVGEFRNGWEIPELDFLIVGDTSLTVDHLHVDAMMVCARTGRNVWAELFDWQFDPARPYVARDEVAGMIVRALAQPHGIIQTLNIRISERKRREDLDPSDHVALFYEYRRTFNPTLIPQLCVGLERAIAEDPSYAEAFACLSQLYIDIFRFRRQVVLRHPDPLARALLLARRAIELAPQSSSGFFSMSLAYWFAGDADACIELLERGLALNPNDTDLRAELGFRYTLRGDWNKGVPLIQQSYRRNPAQPGSYRIGIALWHLLEGRNEEALSQALRTDVQHVIYGDLLVAVSAARLGRNDLARSAWQGIERHIPGYQTNIEADLLKRNVHPDIVAILVQALRGLSLQATNANPAGSADPKVAGLST